MSERSELYTKYTKEIKPELKKNLNISNDMAVPTLEKITINAGIGKEFRTNQSVLEEMIKVITEITGQKPVVTKSKIAIANFKLREGMENGVKVTLRRDRMWDFYYKLVNVALPRVKDFRGVPKKSFDGKGNYSLGIKEHTIFPEIDTSTLQKIRSLQIVVKTTAKNDEEGLMLLEMLGMPFEKK